MNRVEIPLGQVPIPGSRSRLRFAGRDIALFNIDGTLYAVDDSCPHQGASLLGGTLNGRQVQCRAHGLRFDLASGLMPGNAGAAGFGVRNYPVEHEGQRVLLVLPAPDSQGEPQ